MATVKELQPRQGKVDITLDIVSKADAREFSKFGKPGRVCNAKAKDETGEVTITLWNDDIDKVNVGDKVKITNGWVSEWQGELQLSTGRFGQMETVSKNGNNDAGTSSPAAKAAPPAAKPAPKPPASTPEDSPEEGLEMDEPPEIDEEEMF
ncbi:hypothetical protein J4460_08040 [Candidatus Woesearchaeota archaeon]|nr:hypothetical protein [Candidatus Woesearchaeota archaeon]HIH38308.1 hypothetical protein [Candidatus Woesearchaeota archaeon]HIH48446.1 hypothetical protein [Candidatus Woesearchaeota archaeon]HIJ03300.1 hypothetical protein [Candidatus Woesearchaeota archaeon]